jgi:D-alanyl-D-alanine carboxypeptidase
MKLRIILIVIILLSLSYAQISSEPALREKMQRVLDEGINDYNFKGVSAAVIFPEDKIWTGVSGISHDTVSIKPDMLFAIGSITKNMVAALTLSLVEDKILSLDDPVSKWLPSYPHVDGKISLRQLLNHTSGLYMFWDNQQIWDDLKTYRTKVFTPQEVLTYIKEPYFAPGDGWRYSNTNYLLMAMIIEKATNSKLSNEFKKRFWQPLAIENAYLTLQDSIPDNQAHVYSDNFNNDGSNFDVTYLPRASHESICFGSAGLFMTAEDLARWCYALFEGKVLQQNSMNEMLRFIEFNPVANMRAYGLGVQLYEGKFAFGTEAIGHGGANIGTSTYMVYLPEYHVSIVVMINAFPNGGIDGTTRGLIKTILKDFGAIGIIPYFEFFPTGFIILCTAISVTTLLFGFIRKRRKLIRV